MKMPLPDAVNREARVYALLKGQTLQSLTGQLAPGEFFPEAAAPVTIEQVNEDELRRIILLKLAIESIRADWVGLVN